jgi:hypothetical protein
LVKEGPKASTTETCFVKGRAKGKQDKIMLLFWGGKHIGFYVGGVTPCSKNIGDGPIKWLLLRKEKKRKEKKETMATPHSLNNRTTTLWYVPRPIALPLLTPLRQMLYSFHVYRWAKWEELCTSK